MNPVFADTFFWIALTNVEDATHERAKMLILSVRPPGTKSRPMSKQMMVSETTRVLLSTKEIFLAGRKLQGARFDKDLRRCGSNYRRPDLAPTTGGTNSFKAHF